MDHNAFTRVYVEMYPTLVAYINKRISNMHTAEEIAQDVFTRYLERGFDFTIDNPKTKPSLFRAASNAVIDYYRRESFRGHRSPITGEGVFDESTLRGLENSIVKTEIVSTFHRVLEHCTHVDRELFCRRNMLHEPVERLQRDFSLSRYRVERAIRSVSMKIKDSLCGYREDILE